MEHYVTEEDCRRAIEHHREGRSEDVGRVAYLIATHLARDWRCPVETEDLIQEAVLICLKQGSKYRAGAGKAFAYLTSVVLNSFRQSCRESRQAAAKIHRLAEDRHREAGGVGDVRRATYEEN